MALPVLGYSEVTGIQFGATVFRAFRHAGGSPRRASSDAVYFARTARGHTKAYALVERWSSGDARRVRARIEHLSYPLPYFGIGAATPENAQEWYSSAVSTLHLLGRIQVQPGLYLHGGYRLIHSRLRTIEADGELFARSIPGTDGGVVSEIRIGITRDTRDHSVAARRGTWARLLTAVSSTRLGSDFAFRRLTLDARQYVDLARDYSGAAQVQLDVAAGTVPFDQLPMVGADSAMRGYHRGRFRDRNAATAQVELRTPMWRRTGLVLFAGAGAVAHTLEDLGRVPWYPSVGAGLRFVLRREDRSTARLDLGIGRGTLGVNVGLGEAF